jgi:hypothetical protein
MPKQLKNLGPGLLDALDNLLSALYSFPGGLVPSLRNPLGGRLTIGNTSVLDAVDMVEAFDHALIVRDTNDGAAFLAGDPAEQGDHTLAAFGT